MKCNTVTVTEIKYLKLVLNTLVLTQFGYCSVIESSASSKEIK